MNGVLSSDGLESCKYQLWVSYLMDLSFVQVQMTSEASDPLASPPHASQNPHTYILFLYRDLQILDEIL